MGYEPTNNPPSVSVFGPKLIKLLKNKIFCELSNINKKQNHTLYNVS